MRIPVQLLSALLVQLMLAAPAPGSDRELDLQGHRGCRGLMPENSISAFQKAIDLGVTTLELDLQTTGDRVLVVHHDAKLDPGRCVDSDGRKVRGTPFRKLSWSQLDGIDCGVSGDRGFPRQERVPAPIPRLAEVLALARDARYPVRLNIEIKLQDKKNRSARELAALVVEEVQSHGLVARTIVQSFSPEALAAVGEIESGISLAALVRAREDYDQALERSGADILSPRFTGLREADVRRMQQRGIAVIPWTVNKPEAIRRMLDWGVDGIISDYPDIVLDILAERRDGE